MKVYSPIFVSSDEQREGERRFFREAKMLFQLNHMNIVKIYDAGRISELSDKSGTALPKYVLMSLPWGALPQSSQYQMRGGFQKDRL